jgi:hypothetical protein
MEPASCDLESREAETLEARGGAFHRLIPDGGSLLASISQQPGKSQSDEPASSYLGELQHRVYAEVEGHGRSFARLEANPDDGANEVTPPGYFLRFEFNPAQIAALRAGADFGFGIDDDRMRVGAMVKGETRTSLLADLG